MEETIIYILTVLLYNLIALLIVVTLVLGFLKIRTGKLPRKTRVFLEILFLALMVCSILCIAFLDMLALGLIGPVPN